LSTRGYDTVRIAIAEGHRLVADAFSAMFAVVEDFEVVGVATSGSDAVALVAETCPDVVLMATELVGLNGIEATRRIMERRSETRVLLLTMSGDEEMVAQAIAAGAGGLVSKNAEGRVLFDAVRALATGGSFIDQQLARGLLQRVAPLVDESLVGERLTAKESEILQALAVGLAAKEIAQRLFISEETVKTHLSRIYRKLGVNDRVKAVVIAMRRGLVP
jgi:DNA-binding NarL/FixJ family response regulator